MPSGLYRSSRPIRCANGSVIAALERILKETQMQPRAILFLSVLAAALTACDRQSNNPASGTGTSTPPSTSSSGSGQTNSPANVGAPSAAEKKQGANPVQGQVDPKQGEQHRDFQQKGDSKGPKQ
jgi:hypothetical protein